MIKLRNFTEIKKKILVGLALLGGGGVVAHNGLTHGQLKLNENR